MKVECKNSDYKKQRKLGSRFDNYNMINFSNEQSLIKVIHESLIL